MTFAVRVCLRRAYEETSYHYIREIDFDRLVEKGQIRITHQDKIRLGSFEIVSPLDWDRRGVIPMLHVLSPDA
jgi:hypothetical protein